MSHKVVLNAQQKSGGGVIAYAEFEKARKYNSMTDEWENGFILVGGNGIDFGSLPQRLFFDVLPIGTRHGIIDPNSECWLFAKEGK